MRAPFSHKFKKHSINRQSPLLEPPFFAVDPIKSLYRTQKLYVVSNFPALAGLMKPVTHLTSKERIYNPPVWMKRLNLSSNAIIFGTEFQGELKCRSYSLF